jgi:hypothetical protein
MTKGDMNFRSEQAAKKNPAASLRLDRPREWLLGAALLLGLIALVQLWIGWPRLLAP